MLGLNELEEGGGRGGITPKLPRAELEAKVCAKSSALAENKKGQLCH